MRAWPIERSTKLVGRLARENSTRHPGRTAVTSAALMIGLALVVFVTIFANGLRASVSDLIDRTLAEGTHPLFLVEEEYRIALLVADEAFVRDLLARITDPQDGWAPLWASFHDKETP